MVPRLIRASSSRTLVRACLNRCVSRPKQRRSTFKLNFSTSGVFSHASTSAASASRAYSSSSSTRLTSLVSLPKSAASCVWTKDSVLNADTISGKITHAWRTRFSSSWALAPALQIRPAISKKRYIPVVRRKVASSHHRVRWQNPECVGSISVNYFHFSSNRNTDCCL